MYIISFTSKIFQRRRFQLNNSNPKNIKNSDILSITESKNPPKELDLLVIRAIVPSHPSKSAVINTKIEKRRRFLIGQIETKLNIEKQSIIIVAKFGVIPIFIKPLDTTFTIFFLKIFLTRNLEGIDTNFSIYIFNNLYYTTFFYFHYFKYLVFSNIL